MNGDKMGRPVPADANGATAGVESAISTIPYKGLVPYAEEDAPFFFGRDSEQELIIANLMASRLTLLFGESGVGKSSLLRAGVAHRLRQDGARRLRSIGSPESAVVVFSSWRDDPLLGLIQAIEDSGRQAWDKQGVSETAAKSREQRSLVPLVDTLQACADFVDGEVVILLDQFEEYFLYHPHEDGDGTFAVEFARAVSSPGLRASFLVAIRDDALAKLDRFEGRIPNLFGNYLHVEHLDRVAARAAIELPIQQYNLIREQRGSPFRAMIEPALVDTVLDQVKTGTVVVGESGRGAIDEPGLNEASASTGRIETPYLQLVMTRLWAEEIAGAAGVPSTTGPNTMTLRLDTLRELGGAGRIVQTHLDATMAALSTAEREVAARVFHFLVTPSGSKIAHSAADLADYAGLDERELEPVLRTLSGSSARVLRPVAPPLEQPAAVRYEIFHDVLAAAILDWRGRFVREKERAEREARLVETRRQLTQERRRATWLRIGLVTTSLLLLAVVGLAIYAFQQTDAARRAQQIAFSREVAASAMAQLAVRPELSLLLATEAAKMMRTTETEEALRTVLLDPTRTVMRGHTARVNTAMFSPDGRRVVTASRDGLARIWDAGTGRSLSALEGHTREVTSAAFSPDGSRVVTASEDNTARVWDAGTGGVLTQLGGHRVAVSGGAFSADGRRIVTASDATAHVWDSTTGVPLASLEGHTGLVESASFSPDAMRIVTASRDGTARVWDSASGAMVTELRGHSASVDHAEFSSDGQRVVTASRDHSARLWDASNGNVLAQLAGHTAPLTTAVFSPDNARVATGSQDGTARVWDAATGQRVAELRGHTGFVTSVAFSPDGRLVVTGASDNVARIWDASSERSLAELRGHAGAVTHATFAPDSGSVLTASQDGTARVWQAETGQPVWSLRGHSSWVNSAMFSPDGNRVLTSSHDGTTRLWNALTGQGDAVLRGHAGLVLTATFDRGGDRVATASDDRTARVWQVQSGQLLSELRGHTGFVNSVEFAPDGQRLVTASWDGTARVWDAEKGQSLVELRGHSGSVESATFSSDGKRVVTASRDRTARIWDATTGSLLGELGGHSVAVTAAVYSPDGLRLLTADANGAARLWDTAGVPVAELIGHTRELTGATFSPDSRQVLTASEDGTSRLWDARTGRFVLDFRGHAGAVNSAQFSRDGRFIVTAGEDGIARVWNVGTGKVLAELRGHTNEVTDARFGPRSTDIVTASRDGVARVYRCEACGSQEELLQLARVRATRQLTPEERSEFLSQVSDTR